MIVGYHLFFFFLLNSFFSKSFKLPWCLLLFFLPYVLPVALAGWLDAVIKTVNVGAIQSACFPVFLRKSRRLPLLFSRFSNMLHYSSFDTTTVLSVAENTW